MSMWEFIRIISHIVALAGAIVAFFLLYHCGAHHANCNVDTSDTIVTTLSILVTILIGWNIFSALDIKRTVEKKDREIKSAYNNFLKGQRKRINRIKIDNNQFKEEIRKEQNEIKEQIAKQEEEVESAENAYIALFNATQGQVSAINKYKDYLQRYSHYQTALYAMLKCLHFPSDIRHNIKCLIDMMDDSLESRRQDIENGIKISDDLYDEDRDEFIQNMEEICKSTRGEFSVEERNRFINIASDAKAIFENRYKSIEE